MRKAVFLLTLLTVLFAASLFVPGNSWSLIKNNKVVRRIDVTVYFFYGQGCPHCARVEPYISEMAYAYGLNVKRFEIYYNRSNMLLLQDYFTKYNVPADSRGIPIVFTSEGYIEGDINILNGFESLILNSSRANSQQVEASSQTGEAYSSENANVNPLSLFTITVAALVDSINPCSMAILFFLLAGLLLLHKRNKALKVSLAFTLSVFIANLLFGFGILTTIAVSGFSSIFKVAAGLIAVLTGVLLLKDAFHYGGGGFKMEVPEFLRPYLKHKLSKAFYGKSSSIISAFLVGFLVTSFEVPCTGGPYFYVLARMADNATRLQTIPILLYYNLIFVTPLILITAMLYFGSVHVEKAREWKEQNKRLIDFVRGLPMIAVGLITIPATQLSQALTTSLIVYKTLYFPIIIPLIAYVTFQSLSKREKRNKATKWIITTILTATIIAAITTAQTIMLKQTDKTETTSASSQVFALESCPDPNNVTECCIMDKLTGYKLTTDIKASGDCFVINGTVIDCQGHKITGDGTGIAVNISNRNGVYVINCTINNFTTGIYVQPGSEGSVIRYNRIYDNYVGIRYYEGGGTIRRNILFNNEFGLAVYTELRTHIYDNYFFNNSGKNADAGGTHDWNTTKTPGTNIINGPYLGGNYWDDYSGEDLNGDGLGDTDIPYKGKDATLSPGDYLPLVDIIPPQYSNIQAPSGSLPYDSSATYEFNITWKDNVQLDKVFLELDGVNYTLDEIDEYLGFDSNYRVEHRANYSISFTGLEPGTHSYRWYANDTRNNWNSTMLYNFTLVDVTPPTITVYKPENTTYNSSWVPVELNVDEPVLWVKYSLDNGANVTLWTNVTAGTYKQYIYIQNYGNHKIIFYAKDQAGNIGKTETIYFATKYTEIGGGSRRPPLLT